MALRSKFFRVAREGATTDGRKITRDQITQMAKNFNPATYGARVWMEHLRGMTADSLFKALGDVVAVDARDEGGKLGLYAQLEPLPDLVNMASAKQKIYFSIEMDPSFSDTGEAYLVGLGVTDSPASLGTDVMTFSAGNPSILGGRKQRAENVFSAAEEVAMELEAEYGADKPSLFARVKELLGQHKQTHGAEIKQIEDSVTLIAQAQQDLIAVSDQTAHQIADATAKIGAFKADLAKLASDHAALIEKLSTEPDPAHKPRPTATGGNASAQTDC